MGRGTKVGAIIASITALLTSLAVIVFLILGLCEVFPLDSDKANEYHIVFIADDHVLYDHYLVKGTKIEMDFAVPGKPDDEKATDYRFIGWDTNNDNIVNPIPSRAYGTFTAVAVYSGTQRTITPTSEESI